MEIPKSKPLTIEQLKTIVAGLELLDEHPLAICAGCMIRHKSEECPFPESDARYCFDEIIWRIGNNTANIKALLRREMAEQIKQQGEKQ